MSESNNPKVVELKHHGWILVTNDEDEDAVATNPEAGGANCLENEADTKKENKLNEDMDKLLNLKTHGLSFLKAGDVGDAIRCLTEAISLDPTDSDLFHARSEAYIKSKNYRKAKEDVKKGNKLDGTTGKFLELKKQGLSFLKAENVEEAIRSLTEAINLDPTDSDLFHARSEAYIQSKKYLEAKMDVNKGNELDGTTGKATELNSRASVLFFEGKFMQAAQMYTLAITYDPTNATSFRSRSCAYNKAGKYFQSRVDMKTANDLSELNIAVEEVEKQASTFFNEGEFEEAIKIYTQAIDLDPTDPELYRARSSVKTEVGMTTEAGYDMMKANELSGVLTKLNQDKVYRMFVSTVIAGEFENFLNEELRCVICTDVLIEPVTVSCSHTFCDFCLAMWREEHNHCPICFVKLSNTSFPSVVLDNVIKRLFQKLSDEDQGKRQDLIKERSRMLNEMYDHNDEEGHDPHELSDSDDDHTDKEKDLLEDMEKLKSANANTKCSFGQINPSEYLSANYLTGLNQPLIGGEHRIWQPTKPCAFNNPDVYLGAPSFSFETSPMYGPTRFGPPNLSDAKLQDLSPKKDDIRPSPNVKVSSEYTGTFRKDRLQYLGSSTGKGIPLPKSYGVFTGNTATGSDGFLQQRNPGVFFGHIATGDKIPKPVVAYPLSAFGAYDNLPQQGNPGNIANHSASGNNFPNQLFLPRPFLSTPAITCMRRNNEDNNLVFTPLPPSSQELFSRSLVSYPTLDNKRDQSQQQNLAFSNVTASGNLAHQQRNPGNFSNSSLGDNRDKPQQRNLAKPPFHTSGSLY